MKRALCLLLCLLTCLSLLPAASAAGVSVPSTDSTKISAKNKMVIMCVSYATGEFKDSIGGVMDAVPIKDSDSYALYDVVLYSDRICLYRFHGDINQSCMEYINSHPGWKDYGKIWRKFRDSCCLKTVKVKNDDNYPDLNSAKRLSAYKKLMSKAAAPVTGWGDLYLAVKKTKKSSLLKLYDKAFIYYANNKKQLGRWKDEYGYGVSY